MSVFGFKPWVEITAFVLVISLVGGIVYFFYAHKTASVAPPVREVAAVPKEYPTDPGRAPTFGTIKDARLEAVFLTAKNGMTLYTNSSDVNELSSCNEACAATWPPYIVASAQEVAVPPIVQGPVSITKRADSKLQLTYKGMPLYFYKNDKKPGDTTGQKIGGIWFVAKL